MLSTLLRESLEIFEKSPVPDLIDPEIDKETDKVTWCQFMWQTENTTLRIYVYGNERQALLGHTRRLWVPLENIRIGIELRREPFWDYPSIGSGGDHCISFSDNSVDGIKEAFSAALAAAESTVESTA